MPGWVWAVGGSVLAVVVVLAIGLGLQRRGRGEVHDQPGGPVGAEQSSSEPGAADGQERWVRRTHEASGATWEFPTTGESFPMGSIVRVADQKPIQFNVYITDIPAREKKVAQAHPLTILRTARVGSISAYGPVASTGNIDGRPSVVIRVPNSTVTLVAADHDRLYEFKVHQPERDEGERRAKRFFESIRITHPMPSEPAPPSTGGTTVGVAVAGGEAIPEGWDRVQVPRTKMTLLMPKGPPSYPIKRVFPNTFPVNRGLVTEDGNDVNVSVVYIEATAIGPNIGDPFGGVKQDREFKLGGYPAHMVYRDFLGVHFINVRIQLDNLKFIELGISGSKVDPTSAEAKRVLDSISFTVPAKKGPEAPEDFNPRWTRRFAPKTTFSAELPGPGGPANEVGIGAGKGITWSSRGRQALPGRKQMGFFVNALGFGPGPGAADPRKVMEVDIGLLPKERQPKQLVRRVEIDGRPAYIAAHGEGWGRVREDENLRRGDDLHPHRQRPAGDRGQPGGETVPRIGLVHDQAGTGCIRIDSRVSRPCWAVKRSQRSGPLPTGKGDTVNPVRHDCRKEGLGEPGWGAEVEWMWRWTDWPGRLQHRRVIFASNATELRGSARCRAGSTLPNSSPFHPPSRRPCRRRH